MRDERGVTTLGTPLSASATRVLLLGSGELGKEVVIELQRLGCEVIACDRYDDMRLMLWFGTLSYGIAFIFALPMWYFIDEFADRARVPVATVLVWGAAGLYGDLLVLDLLRYHVAPHVTVVEEGARNMGDFGEGCLPPLPNQAPISGGN